MSVNDERHWHCRATQADAEHIWQYALDGKQLTEPSDEAAASRVPSTESAMLVSAVSLLPGGRHTSPVGSAVTSTST